MKLIKKLAIVAPTLGKGGAEKTAELWGAIFNELDIDCFYLLDYPTEQSKKLNNVEYLAESEEEYKSLHIFSKIRIIRKKLMMNNVTHVIPFIYHVGNKVFIATRFTKIKIFQTVRNNPDIVPYGTKQQKIRNFVLNKSEGIIYQTQEQVREEKVKNSNVFIVGNVVDEYYIENYKRKYSETNRFVMVGRLSEQKNYRFAIENIAKLVKQGFSLTLDIYGEGHLGDEIRKIISDFDMENNIFLNDFDYDIRYKIKDYDFYLLTSNYEGLPNSLLEAMASGLVCISSNCSTGPKTIISTPEIGYLYDLDDDNMFRSVIIEAMALSIDERSSMGLAGHISVLERYSKKSIKENLSSISQLI